MSANGRFRTSFLGGFRKKDVLSYIVNYQRQTQHRIQSLESQLTVYQNQLNEEKSNSFILEDKLKEMEQAVAELHNLGDEIQKAVEQQNDVSARPLDIYAEQPVDDDTKSVLNATAASASVSVGNISDAVSNINGVKADLKSMARSFSEKLAQIDLALTKTKATLAASISTNDKAE